MELIPVCVFCVACGFAIGFVFGARLAVRLMTRHTGGGVAGAADRM